MNPLLVGMILILTVTVAMAFGIILGYGLFTSILHFLGRHEHTSPAPALVHGQAASGSN